VERWCLGAYLNVDVLAGAQVGTMSNRRVLVSSKSRFLPIIVGLDFRSLAVGASMWDAKSLLKSSNSIQQQLNKIR
jgi:hypothetical protein